MPEIYIDGQAGTTGLEIVKRLSQRDDIHLDCRNDRPAFLCHSNDLRRLNKAQPPVLQRRNPHILLEHLAKIIHTVVADFL